MKIGITGGTGFVGQYFLKKYASSHHFQVITSRKDFTSLFQHENIVYKEEKYSKEGFKTVFCNCDCIVHLGAKRSTKEREESINNYFENLEVAEDLFLACNELGIRNIVNVSSTAVYDSSVPYPFQEKNATSPLSRYGATKLLIENIANLYNSNKQMHIKSLRLAQVLGVGERAGYMLSVFLEKSIKKETLQVYGKGISGREYIYINDVVEAIMLALHAVEKCGIYNIGSGQITSNLELAQAYCKVFNNEGNYKCLVDKAETHEKYLMNIEKAKNELGYSPKYQIDDALMDMKRILSTKS